MVPIDHPGAASIGGGRLTMTLISPRFHYRNMNDPISAEFSNTFSPVGVPSTRRCALNGNVRSHRQSRFAKSFVFLAMSLIGVGVVGCGGDPADGKQAKQDADAANPTSVSTELAPTEIVSQFLDRVRRGGQEASSNELLTKLAQQELTRIGRPFEFPGSPDTVFEVRQSFPIPDQSDAVWVHTYLTEPGDAGQNMQYEVVWTLRKESAGWRVSGFVVDQGEGMEPLEFDFENGDEMAAKLSALEQPDDSVVR